MRLVAFVGSVVFALAIAVIANLAWATGLGTSAPWFSSAVSGQTYGVTLLVGSIVAISLAITATGRAAQFDEALRALNLRIEALRDAAGVVTPGDMEEDPLPDGVPDRIDAVLDDLQSYAASPVVEVGQAHPNTVVRVPEESTGVQDRPHAGLYRELRAQRARIRAARGQIWAIVAGPIAAATVFIGLAGAMLPGSEGFAAANFRVNTALVLFLGYSLALLVAWAVFSLAMVQPKAPRAVEP